jgi:glycerol-3-phosphate O-acyltransferase
MGLSFSHIIPKIEDWPIYKISSQRSKFIVELNDFVFERITTNSSQSLEDIIAKSIYLETQRLRSMPWKVDPIDEKEYWKTLGTELTNALKSEQKKEGLEKLLKRIINRYNEEIVGHFNIKTFKFVRKILTFFFKVLFNKFYSKQTGWFWGKKKHLYDKIKLAGYAEETRALFQKGTVVIVPTHFSNLDSIMIGFTMDFLAGMPAFAYGAGLNLYNTEIVAYFFNRLGAYRIDRRKKNPIYLECLTSMAAYSLYKGVNNIFFPGGTRSRSGAMEDKLKFGLLGSVIDAQRLILEHNNGGKIFVVPLVLDYNFVLEAKSLVDQHLQAIGKEKYQKERDQSKSVGSKWAYFKLFFKKQSEMVMSFGEPMDVLGNRVNENGESIDKNGNVIDLSEYFVFEGHLSESSQRESVYTRILADKVLQSYFRNNVVLTSHLVAYAAFQMFQRKRKDLNLFALLRMHPKEFSLDYSAFKVQIEIFVSLLREMAQEGKIKLSDELNNNTDDVIKHGMELLGSYHIETILGYDVQKNIVYSEDLKLLHFYANRLIGYEFDDTLHWGSPEKFRYLDKIKESE